jgi:hypothetical protein
VDDRDLLLAAARAVRTRQRPYAATPEKHKPGFILMEIGYRKRQLPDQEVSTNVPVKLLAPASFRLRSWTPWLERWLNAHNPPR